MLIKCCKLYIITIWHANFFSLSVFLLWKICYIMKKLLCCEKIAILLWKRCHVHCPCRCPQPSSTILDVTVNTVAVTSYTDACRRGHVYMRRGAHQRREPELDVYFEQSYLRANEPLNQRQQAWQEAHSSENSDAETEVTNYFRASKQHPSSHRVSENVAEL